VLHYYYKEGDEVPFCPKCLEKDGKQIHLPEPDNYVTGRARICRVCSEEYSEGPQRPLRRQ
jgi:hypothetical protein